MSQPYDFTILTDSSADLGEDLVREMDIQVLPLSFTIQDKTYHNYPDNHELSPHTFYKMLREGQTATTAAVNVEQYLQAMEPELQAGRDVLVLAFSSGLSATYNSSAVAAEELREKYPERKIYTVDTLCASLGQGLLVYLCAREKAAGRSLTGLRDYAEATKGQICHWFTVDDLNHLKRGGRISAATALVGTMLSIKPVLHVDDEGRLISVSKARGRKASLMALVDRMEATALDAANGTVFISHGDCEGDALLVADEITRRFGNRDIHLNYVGPVIGNHSGPGTVALFFVGSKR